MKFFTRLSPVGTSILALSMAVFLAFWGLSAPTASAGDGYWLESPGSTPEVCDFLEFPGDPTTYICADWIVDGETQRTCCIDQAKRLDGNFEDCRSLIWDFTTDERPGL